MPGSQAARGLRLRCICAVGLFAALGCGTTNSEDSEWLDRSALPLQPAETFEGTLRRTIVDPAEGEGPPRAEDYLELTDGKYVRVEAGSLGNEVKSGQRVRVFGRLEGEHIRASRFEPLERLERNTETSNESTDETEPGRPLEAVTPRATGASKKIAVILVSLSGAPNNFNPDQVRTAVFGATGRSSRTFWEENSFGKLTIKGHLNESGDVFGPYTISGNCSYSNVVNASAQAAMAAGVDLSAYDHVVRYTPANASGCGGGGQGDQPGKNSIIYGIGINALWDYVGHEVGHNFGCGHASSYDNCQGRFAGSCQHNEYGDPTDIMGRRNGHYMSYYKNALGWLEPESHAVVTASRQVRLYPIERPSSGLLSVLVPRGDNTQFHLEFRRPIGFDSFLETGLTNGVLLRYLPSGNGGLPHLINFATQTSAVDASLRPGTSFTDGNREIRVVEVNTESALVDIVIDGVPPTPAGGMSGMPSGGSGGMPSGGSGGMAGGAGGRVASAGTAGVTAGGSAGASDGGAAPGGQGSGGLVGVGGGAPVSGGSGNTGVAGNTSGSGGKAGSPSASAGASNTSGAAGAARGGSAGFVGSAGSASAGAPLGAAGFAGVPNATAGASATPAPSEDSGCACRVPGVGTPSSSSSRSPFAFLALILGLAWRRRALHPARSSQPRKNN